MSAIPSPQKKPLWWAWFIVIPTICLTALAAWVSPFLLQEAAAKRLESQGVVVYRGMYHPIRPVSLIERIPGLANWDNPVTDISVRWHRIRNGNLAAILRDVRQFEVSMDVDLTGTQQLNRDLNDLAGANVGGLRIDRHELNAESFRLLARLAPLQALTLIESKFDNRDLVALKALTQLTVINLDDSSINDEGLRSLSTIANLTNVSICKTQASETAKEELCRVLPNLQLSDD